MARKVLQKKLSRISEKITKFLDKRELLKTYVNNMEWYLAVRQGIGKHPFDKLNEYYEKAGGGTIEANFCIMNKEPETMYIFINGSNEAKDWIINFKLSTTKLQELNHPDFKAYPKKVEERKLKSSRKVGKIAKGWAEEHIECFADKQIEMIEKYNPKKIVYISHSKGGPNTGVANLHVKLKYGEKILTENYSIGSPRWCKRWVEDYLLSFKNDKWYNIVNKLDLIPHVHTFVAGFITIGERIWVSGGKLDPAKDIVKDVKSKNIKGIFKRKKTMHLVPDTIASAKERILRITRFLGFLEGIKEKTLVKLKMD